MPNNIAAVRMLNFKRMRKLPSLISFAAIALLMACGQEPEAPIDHSAILYKKVKPIGVHVVNNPVGEKIAALQKRVDLRYPMQVGDTLDVCDDSRESFRFCAGLIWSRASVPMRAFSFSGTTVSAVTSAATSKTMSVVSRVTTAGSRRNS